MLGYCNILSPIIRRVTKECWGEFGSGPCLWCHLFISAWLICSSQIWKYSWGERVACCHPSICIGLVSHRYSFVVCMAMVWSNSLGKWLSCFPVCHVFVPKAWRRVTEMEKDSHASCQPPPIAKEMLYQFPGLSKPIRRSSTLGIRGKNTAGGIADVKQVYSLSGVEFPFAHTTSSSCIHSLFPLALIASIDLNRLSGARLH